MKITFYGAVHEVTGSRYLIESGSTRIMVDCGSFQGKDNEDRERDPLPLDPQHIDAIVLTHAHIDHTGYIPRFVKDGFRGNIYCSKGTQDLSEIMLIDSAVIEEENAQKKSEEGHEVKPLYTVEDAERALQFFKPTQFDTAIKIGNLSITLINSGHILGAAFVIVTDGNQTLTFSGDLGRPNQLLIKAPPHIKQTDYLVLESTYGNRLHSQEDPVQEIGKIVQKTLKRDGVLIIPSFAVGRTQAILYILYQLRKKGVIPECPIFLDSPMAIKVTDLACRFKDEIKIPANVCDEALSIATYSPTQKDSIALNDVQGPAIIVAGSGMSEGGRVLHHFIHRIEDSKNTVLFVGYQADGTLGRALTEGEKKIYLFGRPLHVRATIEKVDMLSAHADYNEILDWLSYFTSAPKKIFLTHGELESAQSLQKKIEERFGWMVVIPAYKDSFELN